MDVHVMRGANEGDGILHMPHGISVHHACLVSFLGWHIAMGLSKLLERRAAGCTVGFCSTYACTLLIRWQFCQIS